MVCWRKILITDLTFDHQFMLALEYQDSGVPIAMAHTLNLSVIAEGVETGEQQDLLLSNGCSSYQGYFFGKPVPIEQFDAALKT